MPPDASQTPPTGHPNVETVDWAHRDDELPLVIISYSRADYDWEQLLLSRLAYV